MEGGPRALFGRAVEQGALRAAIAGDQPTVVVGEAGIGKTSLVRAVAAQERRVLREGGALGTLRWTPYLALRRALGVAFEGDPVAVASEVEHLVGPDVLFVDDFQWTDDGTRVAVELLARRILLVLCVRSDDPLAEDALSVCRRAGLDVIGLGPLLDADAAAVIRDRQPGLAPAIVERFVRQADGNPLLLEELATGGPDSPAFSRSVARRLDALRPAARATVEILAIVERWLEREAAGPGVAEAVASGLVIERDHNVAIRHDLVAAAILDHLTPAERRRLHVRAAGVVTDRAERVRHLAAAGRRTAAASLARAALEESGDPRERAALLAIAAEVGPTARNLSLRLSAARELDELSEWATIVRLLAAPSDAAAEELVERDSILAHARFALGDLAASRTILAAAGERAVPPSSAAAVRRAIETATFMVNVDGAVGAAVAVLDAALATAPVDSAAARDLTILRASILLLGTGTGDQGLIRTGFEEAFRAGRYRTATDRARVLQYLLLMGASSAAALAYLLDLTDRYEAAGVGSISLEFQADAVVAAVLSGALDRAVSLADEVLERPAPPRARQTAEIHRARALALLGRFDDAEAALTRLEPSVSSDYFGRAELLTCQAEVALWSGRPSNAVKLGEASLAVTAPIPAARVAAAITCAWARFELGLESDRESAFETALPPSVSGAEHELEGLRMAHAGEDIAAAAAFDRAAAGWSGFHEPRSLACRWAAADARRRGGERQEAVERLADVLRTATGMGFEALGARIRRSLRQAGVRATAGTRDQAAVGGLTARERQLVGLVGRGLTNIEIARRLGLGRPTVARILSSAMGKLGVDSRAQLAARVEA